MIGIDGGAGAVGGRTARARLMRARTTARATLAAHAAIARRKAGNILTGGTLEVLDSPENMLVFQRVSGNKNQRVMFNFGTKDALFEGEKVEALSSVFGQPMPG